MMTSRLVEVVVNDPKKRKTCEQKADTDRVEDTAIEEPLPEVIAVDEGEPQSTDSLLEDQAEDQLERSLSEARLLMTAPEARIILGTLAQHPVICTRCGTPFECWAEDFCLCPSCEDELNG